MAEASGEDVAVLLLRVLPAEVAEGILAQMGAAAPKLRDRLRDAPAEPPLPAEVDAALVQFFDLYRIAQRAVPTVPAPETETQPEDASVPAAPTGPLDQFRALPPDQIARALDGEQPGAIAMLLSCLDPVATGHVIRRLPAEIRPEIALRLTKPGARNVALLQPLAQAVVEKARRLADLPTEPTQEELIQNLANMLRTFPRDDRTPVLARLEETDPELAAKVIAKLYRIEDILRIPDRQIQMLLGKLDVKTVAVALKGADPALLQKVTANMSSRSKTVLAEESELLGAISDSVVREAQGVVLAAIRKGEEDGQITME